VLPLRSLTSRAPLSPARVSAVVVLLLATLGLWRVLPVARAGHVSTWPGGVVHYWDASDTAGTVDSAAARWNATGARVRLVRARSEDDADVVVRVDDRRLLRRCGEDCLGFSSSIGRPWSGHAEVLLAGSLGRRSQPLSVWVAAHEFGHILGLRHRRGRGCTLMSEHAFDTRCAPSLDTGSPTSDELACVPAPRDITVAVGLYGGTARRADPRCR
jgi:hypothetical protein